jgi:hypothetical protein
MKSVKLSLNGLRRLIREAADEAERLGEARPKVKAMFDQIWEMSKRDMAGTKKRKLGLFIDADFFNFVVKGLDQLHQSNKHLTTQAIGQATKEYLENECDSFSAQEAKEIVEDQGSPIASPSYDPKLLGVVDKWVKEHVDDYTEFDDADGKRKMKGQKTKGSLFDKFLKSTGLKSSKKKEIPDNAWELEDERAAGGGTPRRFLPRG